MRVDFNVPITDGRVDDDFKIAANLPTIRYLLRYDAKIILISHLDIEPGQKGEDFSLKPAALVLEKLIGQKVKFISETVGFKVEEAVYKMKSKDVLLLENLRFSPDEENNNSLFARRLARLADIYINNAFAVSHRRHASLSAIKKYLPSYAGLLLEREIEALGKIAQPKKPLIVVMGGAKIETKLPLLKKFLRSAEKVLIGGVLANDFLAARGFPVGKSLADPVDIKIAKKIKSKKILLPIDVVVSQRRDGGGEAEVKSLNKVGKNDIILDIGPATIKLFSRFIKSANTLVWNGPLGKFEAEHFRHGTLAIGRLVAARSTGPAFGVTGGGETLEALRLTKMAENFDWISTGGGAMLTYLSKGKMPGLKGIVKS